MVNAKKTSFTATQLANNGMAMGAAFMRILELEKEVSRLQHHVSVLSKRLNGREKKEDIEEKEEVARVVAETEVAAETVVEAEVTAVGAPPITSGVYKDVAEEGVVAEGIVAGLDAVSVGSEEDEVVDGKIVVKLPDDRKRRIVEEEEVRDVVEENSLIGAIPVGPRSGVERVVTGERGPSRPSNMFAGRGRDIRNRGFGFGMEGYGYRGRGRGREGYYY